jgi:hypothetical protein
MKISSFKRLIKEDVEDQFKPIMEKIGTSVNVFAEEVTEAFNNKLSIEDNFNQTKRQVTVTVNAGGVPIAPLQFKSDLAGNCYGIQTVRAENMTSSSVYPTGYPFFTYTEKNGVITVSHITGLPSGNKFKLNLVLLG